MNISNEYTDIVQKNGTIEESKNNSDPETLISPKQNRSKFRIFVNNFLHWGNIFQSFIGTSILSLPYYCYRVY